jgi:hypothetical protein
MRNKRELQGYWKPSSGERWIGGTAVYHPEEGIELQLFEPISDESFTEQPSFDYILGSTSEEGQVTLRNCRHSGTSIGGGTLNTEKYRAQSLFIGNHISESEPSFTRFRVNYPLLHQWAGLTGIEERLSRMDDDEEYDPNEIDVHYSPPDAKKAKGENREVQILTSANITHATAGSFSINENTYIEIAPTSGEIGFESLMDEVNNWRDFLTLAVNDNIGINEIRAYRETESGEEDDVQVYYEASGEFNYPENFHPHRTNFQLDDLEERASSVLQNWMQLTEQYKSVYDLYFAVVYQNQMYLENQHMMLVSALSFYYQERYDYKYLDEERFQTVMNTLSNSLSFDLETDEEFRSHLHHEVLPTANQHSLERRLSAIAEDHQDILAELPWDTAEEISDLARVHNYTVGQSSKLQEAGPEWLYKKTVFMSTLFEIIILKDLDVPTNHIKTQLSRKYQRRLDIP